MGSDKGSDEVNGSTLISAPLRPVPGAQSIIKIRLQGRGFESKDSGSRLFNLL